MDRKILKLPFTLKSVPDWTCPTCGKGMLRIKKDTFFKEEVLKSRSHNCEAWEPEWLEYVYSCLFVCNNEQCKEVVASSGVGSVDSDMDEDEKGEMIEVYEDYFRPRFFEPHLVLMNIPEKCPEAISAPLKESFRLFFAAPSAAANNVRVAIEELLTDLKVKRFNVKNNKRHFISLHQRIDLMPPKHAKLKALILAIKWLGNAGSHSHDGKNEISMDDVMDLYELMEHVLGEIYSSKTKKLEALAKKVNKKKGPGKKEKPLF